MQITGGLNDEYLIMSMISRHGFGPALHISHTFFKRFSIALAFYFVLYPLRCVGGHGVILEQKRSKFTVTLSPL